MIRNKILLLATTDVGAAKRSSTECGSYYRSYLIQVHTGEALEAFGGVGLRAIGVTNNAG